MPMTHDELLEEIKVNRERIEKLEKKLELAAKEKSKKS